MPPIAPDIMVQGDASGNGMVLRFPLDKGASIYAVGVPLPWPSTLGPIWTYLIEADVPTIVDTGPPDTIYNLRRCLNAIGRRIRDIKRVILTHGHIDHDGNAYEIVKHAGAELWAHEVYGYFLDINYLEWEEQFHQRFMRREGQRPYVIDEETRARHQEYRSRLWLSKPLHEGQLDGWRFYHVPGHTPEELCIQRGPYLMTGDHVLPQITPHPTMRLRYDLFKEALPLSYRKRNIYFGLHVFLRSLKRITRLEGDLTLLPAHRLYYKGKFNLIDKTRAEEIIDHHRRRLGRILDVLDEGPLSITELTVKHFRGTDLSGQYLYLAMDEVIAHLELLQEAGDVAYQPDDPHMVKATGTRGYEGLLARL